MKCWRDKGCPFNSNTSYKYMKCLSDNYSVKECEIDNKNNYFSSRADETYINLTDEEILAYPILLNMAMVYTWELYNKKEGDKFYEAHKENIDMISDFHKNHQGVIAVGINIKNKINNAKLNLEINKATENYK